MYLITYLCEVYFDELGNAENCYGRSHTRRCARRGEGEGKVPCVPCVPCVPSVLCILTKKEKTWPGLLALVDNSACVGRL